MHADKVTGKSYGRKSERLIKNDKEEESEVLWKGNLRRGRGREGGGIKRKEGKRRR